MSGTVARQVTKNQRDVGRIDGVYRSEEFSNLERALSVLSFIEIFGDDMKPFGGFGGGGGEFVDRQHVNQEEYDHGSYGYHEYSHNPSEYYYQENYPPESYVNEQGSSWIDYQSFLDDTGPISSLSFHDSSELLWIGSQTGRLTSYLHYPAESNFTKYSSFLAHSSPVLQILALPKHILSLSSDAVRMHTLGGYPTSQFKPNANSDGEIQELTCGTLFEPFGGLFRAETQKYLFLGSSSRVSYAYDLNFHDAPLSAFDLEVSSVCVQSSVTFLSVGGLDGKIRLLDPSLRSNTVQHVIDAHQGGISSFGLQSDGMALISCGFQSRSLNPYDPNSLVMVLSSF